MKFIEKNYRESDCIPIAVSVLTTACLCLLALQSFIDLETFIVGPIQWLVVTIKSISRDMALNISAEIFGIVLTVMIIDTLYEYRQQRFQNTYSKGILLKLKDITENARTRAFGPIGGGRLLDIGKVEYEKDAIMLVRVIYDLRIYNKEIDSLIDKYSILATPALVYEISTITGEIDSKLNDLNILLRWQVDFGKLSENKDVLDALEFLEYTEHLNTMPNLFPHDDQTIKQHYKELSNKYEQLDGLIEAFSTKKISFWNVVKKDSLIAEVFRRDGKDD
jgi:methyl-accepting chemotaxis protein